MTAARQTPMYDPLSHLVYVTRGDDVRSDHREWTDPDARSTGADAGRVTGVARSPRAGGEGEGGCSMNVLLDAETIQARVKALAGEIERDYPGDEEIHLVCVLKGGFMFMADLVRAMSHRVSLDFIAVSSYAKSTTSSGEVRLLKDLDSGLQGRHVIIVEDIVDTGLTLTYLQDILRARSPKTLRTACLLSKPSRRQVDVPSSTSASRSRIASSSAMVLTMLRSTGTCRISRCWMEPSEWWIADSVIRAFVVRRSAFSIQQFSKAHMKRFEIITEADARSLDIGATVELTAGGHVTPLARDTLAARRVTVIRAGLRRRNAARRPARQRATSGAWRSGAITPAWQSSVRWCSICAGGGWR